MLLSDVGRQTVCRDLIAAESTERFTWRDVDALHGFLPQRIPSWPAAVRMALRAGRIQSAERAVPTPTTESKDTNLLSA
jgi:hypothetical protein